MIVWTCEGWSGEEGRGFGACGDPAVVETGEECEAREASVKALCRYWIHPME